MPVETLSVTDMLSNKYEPRRKHRFLFALEGIDSFLLKTAARPSYNMNPIEIDWINVKRYLAGKVTFDTIELELYDPIAPSGAQQVMEWIRLCTEHVSGRAGYADFYKRDCQIKELGPLGEVVSLWDLKGCFPESVKFGTLDYADAEAQTISLTLRMDICILQY